MSGVKQHRPAGRFLGLPSKCSRRETSAAWVLPIPYEATTSYGQGTRGGPAAIVEASRQIEWFDSELGGEPAVTFGVHTLAPLTLNRRSPKAAVAAIEKTVAAILSGHPAPRVLAVLGGEHSISGGVARGMARAGLRDFVTVHVDAHGDMRDTFLGTPLSHGCAARRILEVSPVFQIGIRSLSAEEDAFRRRCRRLKTVFAEEVMASRAWRKDLAAFVRGRTVYLTIDVDGLDPSEMPAVGTPEPGGLSWTILIDIVRAVCKGAKRVPVFDVVELAPIPGLIAPDFLAAKLAYKTLALALSHLTMADD
jgi:agmatinase